MRFTFILLLGLVSFGALGADVPSIFNTTNRTARTLALDECIRQALERNLRIQARRYDPSISRFTLEASRGIYDPVFSAEIRRFSNSTEGRFNENTGNVSDSNEARPDSLTTGFTGLLPSGLTYDLNGRFVRTTGVNNDGSFENYVADVGITLEQPLLKNFWTDSARTAIQVNRRNLRISELALEEEIRLVTRDVQVAYFELMFSREDLKVQEKALELANKLVSDNKARVEAQKLAPLDVKQSEAQAATALADMIQAHQRILLAENALKNLITDDYQSLLRTTIEPAEKLVAVPERLDLTESWTTALNKRPDVNQLQLEAEKLTLNRKLRSNQRLPELSVFGGYGRNGVDASSPPSLEFPIGGGPPIIIPGYDSRFSRALGDIKDGNNENHTIGALLRIPLSNKNEKNRYRAALESEKQIEVEQRLLKQNVLVQVDNAINVVRASYERVGATHQARLFAELALDAGQKRLEAGIITSFEVLELQSDLTSARSAEIRALADYNNALSLLFYADGTILERNKISVQFK